MKAKELSHYQRIMLAYKMGKQYLTSMDGFRLGITKLTDRCRELKKKGYPIKIDKEDNERFNRYYFTGNRNNITITKNGYSYSENNQRS